MIQGLVNSFGVTVMAAFTVAVKIDSFAYMPAQEFGNAFSLFISQNYGAGVLLAYLLAPVESIGVLGIWRAIPIGWFLADAAGIIYMVRRVLRKEAGA